MVTSLCLSHDESHLGTCPGWCRCQNICMESGHGTKYGSRYSRQVARPAPSRDEARIRVARHDDYFWGNGINDTPGRSTPSARPLSPCRQRNLFYSLCFSSTYNCQLPIKHQPQRWKLSWVIFFACCKC
ncbi:hypothetical protein M405DRAFT_542612 [Rhizopogon salebrosus TDB-379]|nr:hypothetical protein M405DRAFT_542612 [Rhizopogon salebrosus TDB-379]